MTSNLYSMASLDLLSAGPTQTQRPLHKFKKVNRLESVLQEFHQIFLYFLPIRQPNQMSRPWIQSLDATCRKLCTMSYLQAKDFFSFTKHIQFHDVEEFSRDNLQRIIGNSYRAEIPSLMSMQKLDHDPKVVAAYMLLAQSDPMVMKTLKPVLTQSSDDFLFFVAKSLGFRDNTYLSSDNEWALLLERQIDQHRQEELRKGLSDNCVTALPPKAMKYSYFCSNVCQNDEIVQRDIQKQKDELGEFAIKIGLSLDDSYFFVDIRPVEVNHEKTQSVILYAEPDEILSDVSSETEP